MNNCKWTAGPWRLVSEEVVGGSNNTVAIIVDDGPHTADNAHLIAAAPELYEALELMVRYCNMLEDELLARRCAITELCLDHRHEQPPEDVAECALAKARGESK